jgi:tRNA uridine 5-carboxymethylaminomethyl modification enzyme
MNNDTNNENLTSKEKELSEVTILDLDKLDADTNIDYDKIEGLRIEARQKLSKIRPANVGQASRISGVSPADMNMLLVYLQINK